MADWYFLSSVAFDELSGYVATFLAFGVGLSAVGYAAGRGMFFVIDFFRGGVL